jgi:putative transposase
MPDLRTFSRDAHFHFVSTFHTRRLPHFYSVGKPIFLTWRLHGSLPPNRSFPTATSSGQAFVAMDRILDNARAGPLYLRRPEIASMVVEAIHYRDGELEHYHLHNYVVMANHVHLLITPRVQVSKVMQSLKRFTAREGNLILGLTGQPFWQDESYDRLVRDGTEFQRIARYIEMNPVRAGMATAPEEFPWSSAKAD